jgi:hypothetical protein
MRSLTMTRLVIAIDRLGGAVRAASDSLKIGPAGNIFILT